MLQAITAPPPPTPQTSEEYIASKNPKTVSSSVNAPNAGQTLYTVPTGRRFRGTAIPTYSSSSAYIKVNGKLLSISNYGSYVTWAVTLPLELQEGDTVIGYNASIVGVEYDA